MDERMTEASVDKNKTLALRHCNSITFEKETKDKRWHQRKKTELKKTCKYTAQRAKKKDNEKTE